MTDRDELARIIHRRIPMAPDVSGDIAMDVLAAGYRRVGPEDVVVDKRTLRTSWIALSAKGVNKRIDMFGNGQSALDARSVIKAALVETEAAS